MTCAPRLSAQSVRVLRATASVPAMGSAGQPSTSAESMAQPLSFGTGKLLADRDRASSLARTGKNRRQHQGEARALTNLILSSKP